METQAVALFNDSLFDYFNTVNSVERLSIEEAMWEKHGRRGAVTIWDMAGFSKTTADRGIVYYLAMVRRMQIISGPIVEQFGGTVIKYEADNCFAWFKTSDQAIDAAIAMNIAVDATNRTTPDELDIQLSCGIDYGDFLALGDQDYFGNPVIRASKLGEDLGNPMEILITQEGLDAATQPITHSLEQLQFDISGIEIKAYCIKTSGHL